MQLQATAHIDWIIGHWSGKENIIIKKKRVWVSSNSGQLQRFFWWALVFSFISRSSLTCSMTQYQTISTSRQSFNTSQQAGSKKKKISQCCCNFSRASRKHLEHLATTSLVISCFCDTWRSVQMGAGRIHLKLQLHPYSYRRHIFLHTGFFILYFILPPLC